MITYDRLAPVKHCSLEKGSHTTRQSTLGAMIPAVESQKTDSWAKKWRRIHWALAAGDALFQSW
jgi:hypothetical protein